MRRRSTASVTAAIAAVVAVTASVGCVTEPPAAELDQQVDWGAAVYQWHCARCHDPDRSAVELSRDVLVGRDDAAELFEFNRAEMPLDEPGRLPESDYWAVTAYLLERSDLLDLPSDQRLDPESANRGTGVDDPVSDGHDAEDEEES